MKVHPLSPLGGVSISGFDLSRPASPEQDREVCDLYDEHGLIIFKAQNLTKRQLVEAGGRFGGTLIKPAAVSLDPEEPGVTVISTRGPFGDVVPTGDKALVGDLEWHTDQGYVTHPIRGKMLYAVAVPEEQGRTGFIDGEITYRALPDELKHRIEGLHVVQSWRRAESYLARNRDYRINGHQEMSPDRFADLSFPIVLAHPITGNRILNVPPLWAAGIIELPGEEGEALVAELVQFLKQPRFQYWHRYEVGDVALWDNWRFVHAAEGTPAKYVRTIWSTAINGGPQLGAPLARAE